MKEYRIFGPPGTGKTGGLATKHVPDAIEKYGRDKVMVTSFTKAAAAEIASKKSRVTGQAIDLDPSNVGTMHSICFHALGSPKIMEVDYIKEWNALHDKYQISGSTKPMDEMVGEFSGKSQGDIMLNHLNILRNKMINHDLWHGNVKYFEKIWTDFKKEVDAFDFTDLIDVALKTMPYAPNQPEVMFVDEAQDFTQLQLSLVRSWGSQMSWIVLVGDDDQTIYRFTGADPHAFLKPEVPSNMKTVLKQSYRVPRMVLERANELIQQVQIREPKQYSPRREHNTPTGKIVEGCVRLSEATWRNPQMLIEDIKEDLSEEKSCMILASCSYMIDPIKNLLKNRGFPFANRYRQTRGDWNPLGKAGTGDSATDLLTSFLGSGIDGNYWNVPQFVTWAKNLSVGPEGLKRKVGKKGLKVLEEAMLNQEPGLHTAREVLPQILSENAINHALSRNIEWFKENLVARRQETIEYPIEVMKKYGPEMLEKRPPITIGTIHSVKGGEADVVYLFPDISFQADAEFNGYGTEGRDSILRVFYVGMTRAREELVICTPAAKRSGSEPRFYVEL